MYTTKTISIINFIWNANNIMIFFFFNSTDINTGYSYMCTCVYWKWKTNYTTRGLLIFNTITNVEIHYLRWMSLSVISNRLHTIFIMNNIWYMYWNTTPVCILYILYAFHWFVVHYSNLRCIFVHLICIQFIEFRVNLEMIISFSCTII